MKSRIWIVSYLLKAGGEIKGLRTAVECRTAGEAYKQAVKFMLREHGPKSSIFITDIGQAGEDCRELIGKAKDEAPALWDASDWPEGI